jgi:hypothetical protein
MNKGLDTMEQTITSVSYAAGTATAVLGLTVDEWGIVAAIVGIVSVIATFAFNAWFKMKYKRD